MKPFPKPVLCYWCSWEIMKPFDMPVLLAQCYWQIMKPYANPVLGYCYQMGQSQEKNFRRDWTKPLQYRSPFLQSMCTLKILGEEALVELHVHDNGGRRGSSPARPTAASVPAAKGLGLLTTQSELLNGLVVPFNEMIRSSPTCSRKKREYLLVPSRHWALATHVDRSTILQC